MPCQHAFSAIFGGSDFTALWSLGYAQLSGDFDRGMAEFRAGYHSSAAALFANAEYAFPGATDALLYRAKSLVHLQDSSGAEQALDNYITSHHDSSDALYMLGFRSKP